MTEKDTDRRLWTVQEVAEYFQVHEQTVYKWVRQKKLPSVKIGGAVRIPIDAVLKEE